MKFNEYLKEAGLDSSLYGNIETWDELHQILDNTPIQSNIPKPERTPIGAPYLETSWKKNIWKRFSSMKEQGLPIGEAPEWPKVVEKRRKLALGLTLFFTSIMIYLSHQTLVAQGVNQSLIWIYLIIYSLMTYFLVATFFKICIGTWSAWKGANGNKWHPKHTAKDPRKDVKVAIVFPVFHEDVNRVAAGIASVWESIIKNVPENAQQYDIFLLSDSREPGYWIAEKAAIQQLTKMYPEGRFFYRWRTSNDNAKLGNMIDFCRRWGKKYEYMFVMDADSIVSGETIHETLRMMEGNHRLGILQTNPVPVLRKSLFGRMQQFSGHLYGAVFSYSLQAMYMGHASYIGHNAMIRMKPFMEYCMLPYLSGKTPWGGKPLSHDIVEAAMMARAGYEVWFLPDMKGSYEEIPANILGFLIRERRWMQGNLQHLRFLFIDGLKSIHREGFINGMMGYLSAPLWMIFLTISVYTMVSFLKTGFLSFGIVSTIEIPTLLMFAASMVFLFMPRLFAIVVRFPKERSRLFGGKVKMVTSIIVETAFSLLFSPLIMIYVSRFLWLWVKRKSISWGTQQRDDTPLSWKDCWRHFGWVSIIGIVAWYLLYLDIKTVPEQDAFLLEMATNGSITPSSIVFWMFPILGGFTFSTLFVRFTSKTFKFLEDKHFFAIPEEIDVPFELISLKNNLEIISSSLPDPENYDDAVKYALSSPSFYLNNRAETRLKSHISARLLPKIEKGETLTKREVALALRERKCYDKLVEVYCD